MIKVGLIGIGGMGSCHFNEYKKIADANVIAVADVQRKVAEEKLKDENINIYESMEELLANEDVDMVDLCVPSFLHAEYSIRALEKGVHVLCEKPMALSTEDTRKMCDAAAKTDKLFMTAHVVRFMSPYIYLKKITQSNELGKPVHFDLKRISSFPTWSWENWMGDISKSGGTPIDLSVHDIDFVQYLFGQPKKVSGVRKVIENHNDYIISNLVYDDFDVTVTGGWFNCQIPFKAEFLAIFENGYLEYTNGKLIKNGEEVSLEKGSVSEDTGINISGVDGYGGEILYFIECINNNINPEMITPESSCQSIELIEKILENSINI